MDPLRVSEIEDAVRDRVALVADGHEIRFGELAERVKEFVISGSRPLAFVANADLRTILFTFAALDRSVPILPLHPRQSAEQRTALLLRAEAVRVDPTACEPIHNTPIGLPYTQPLALIATSGTSGEPKLAVLGRHNFVASARASEANLGWHDDDRWLLCLPFSHVGGLSVITRCLIARRTLVVQRNFDPDRVLDAIVRERVTLLSVVPSILTALVEHDRENRLAKLRAVLVGGATFSSELRREARTRGVPALATYGLSETCSQIATQRLDEDRDPESLDSGRPLDGVEVSISSEGRIRVRGPMLMRGYLGEPELLQGSFFDTRDVGALDEQGRLVVLGRADDVIVTGGEKTHPSVVERALLREPGVQDALAFGVPDARWGARVAVALVLATGVRPEDVIERASRRLATYERPRCFACVKSLPLDVNGKVDRRRAVTEISARLALLPS